MINRLWPHRRELCTLLLADEGGRSRAAAASLALSRRLTEGRRYRERLRGSR